MTRKSWVISGQLQSKWASTQLIPCHLFGDAIVHTEVQTQDKSTTHPRGTSGVWKNDGSAKGYPPSTQYTTACALQGTLQSLLTAIRRPHQPQKTVSTAEARSVTSFRKRTVRLQTAEKWASGLACVKFNLNKIPNAASQGTSQWRSRASENENFEFGFILPPWPSLALKQKGIPHRMLSFSKS